jgi:hypothetical protein
MIIQTDDTNTSFKRALTNGLKECDVKIYKNISFDVSKGIKMELGDSLGDDEKILVVKSSRKNIKNITIDKFIRYLGTLEEFKDRLYILNPSITSEYSKPYYQLLCHKLGIPTPPFNYSTYRKEFSGWKVVKRMLGQGGWGVHLRHNNFAEYYQDWIKPPDLPFIFDLRIYTFLYEYLGSTVRIKDKSLCRTNGDGCWGITNTHENGEGNNDTGIMIHFDKNINPRPRHRQLYHDLRDWLQVDSPKGEWIRWAEEISRQLGLAYCTIDIIFDDECNPYVIDVNPNARQGTRFKDMLRVVRAIKKLEQMKFIESGVY